MNRVFKQTLIFAALLTVAIFGLQFLLAVTNIFLSLAGAIIGLGSIIPGSSNGFVLVQSVLQLAVLIMLIFLMGFLMKKFGAKFLGDSTLKGVVNKSMKAPFQAVGKTGKQGMNFMRGLMDLNQSDLRKLALRKNLFGGGRTGRLLNKGVRAKDDFDIMKSIAERGADGKKRKENLKNLSKQGLTPKDTRVEADRLKSDKERARLANLGIDENLLNNVGDDDRNRLFNIADQDDLSLKEKRDKVKEIRLDNLRDKQDKLGYNFSDDTLEKLADRKHNAAIAHGQQLDQHVNNAVDQLEKGGFKVYDDNGNETSYKDYVEAKDDKAIVTSDKFRQAHRETLGAYGAAHVAGTTMALYALDISRTNEENRNSTVNGSLTPAYNQPVASSEERETDHAARVHGRIPVDETVAAKHADKAVKDMNDVASSDVGFKSTGEAPVEDDKTIRDDNGNAVSTFSSRNDDYVQAAETINTGSPYGNMLPLSLTEDFDPENMTEENIAAAAQMNMNTYAAGAFNPDVISGQISSDDIDNAFASDPLTLQQIYGYQQNANLSEHREQQQQQSSDGLQAAASTAAFNDGLENAFADDGSQQVPNNQQFRNDEAQQSQLRDEAQQFRNDEAQQRRNDQMQQRIDQEMRDEASQRTDRMDSIDQMFSTGSSAPAVPPQINQNFQQAWTSGNSQEMSRNIEDLAQNIGVKHSLDLSIPQDQQDRLNDMVKSYQRDLNAGMFSSMDAAQARIRDISSFAAGSISKESVRSIQRSESESKDAEKRVQDAQNVLSDSLEDMLSQISRETMNNKAEEEEEERRRQGTRGIRDRGNTGRQRR